MNKLSLMLKTSFALCCIGFFLTNSNLNAKEVKVKLEPIATNMGVVTDINVINNYMYICTQPGVLLRKDLTTSSTLDYTLVVDIQSTVGILGYYVPSLPGLGWPVPGTYDERGLLGFAADPAFNNVNGTFYIWYTNNSQRTNNPPNFFYWDISTNQSWDQTQWDHIAYVDQYQMTAGVAARVGTILAIKCPFFNHTGFSSLVWSPEQNTLLLGVGDCGSEYDPFNIAQDPALLGGKLLQLNLPVLSAINWPADYPNGVAMFSELPADALTVLITGLRNPDKVHFEARGRSLDFADSEDIDSDDATRRHSHYIKYLGNTGQDTIEWVHGFRNWGHNFGFRPWEGNFNNSFEEPGGLRTICYPLECTALPNFYRPLVAYNHLDPAFGFPNALTGMCLYNGDSIPGLKRRLVYCDWYSAVNLAPCDSSEEYFHGSLFYSKPDRDNLEKVVPTKKMNVSYKAAGAKHTNFFYTTVNTDAAGERIFVGGNTAYQFIINMRTYPSTPLYNPGLAGGVYEVVAR